MSEINENITCKHACHNCLMQDKNMKVMECQQPKCHLTCNKKPFNIGTLTK